MNTADSTAPAPSMPGFSARNVLLVAIPLCLIIGAVGGYLYFDATRERDQVFDSSPYLRRVLDTPEKLDPQFTDANNDMVADPPAQPEKLLDPATLVFSTLGDDAAREEETWKDFVAFLKKTTGKDVKLVQNSYLNREQAATLAEGSAHIVNLSTGNVPLAVNAGGFVPDCVMADDSGKWGYNMEVIVPADSSIKSLADLRGKRLALANMRSHSGFKAPMVELWSAHQMRPERDYEWLFAGTQGMTIQRIKRKESDAAPVASDFLRREQAAGRIAAGQYRVIFTSPTVFPPSCFGHVHNLKPELAANIRVAFLTFPWAGTSLEKAYAAAGQTKFVAINFKDDWAGVRAIDAQMKQLVTQKR